MEGLLCMIILVGCLGLSRQDETVYLREVDSAGSMGARQSGPDRRHFPASLQLAFYKRGRTDPVMLTLEENRRLNANAPVYTTVTKNGRQMVERVASGPLTEGNFYIDGTNYDISPVVRGGRLSTRMSGRHGTPHVLREALVAEDRKYTEADRKFVDDTMIPPQGLEKNFVDTIIPPLGERRTFVDDTRIPPSGSGRAFVDDTRIPPTGSGNILIDDTRIPPEAANNTFEDLFRRKYGIQVSVTQTRGKPTVTPSLLNCWWFWTNTSGASK
ncbi:hypothetical protein MAR_002512, partial [Mya arenaria]